MFYLTKGQVNLVPNPSFETYTQCPDDWGQIENANGWIDFGSADYFNACAPTSQTPYFFSVPSNSMGYQYAATGNAYCSFVTYAGGNDSREFIGTQLSSPLEIGKKYFVSFKINLAGKNSFSCYANNKIGILFSTSVIDYSTAFSLPNFAHIYTDSIITDTLNWVTISGIFIADSAYQYMMAGNFFSDSLTNSIMVDSTNTTFGYYLFDDFFVGLDSPNAVKENSLQNTIQIFSDLANSQLIISFKSNEIQKATAKIYNIIGELMDEYSFNNTTTINTFNYSSGIYILRVEANNQIINKKILITHQ